MPLNLSQKKDLVKEMSTVLSDAEVVLTADYSGLTSNELNQLRKTTREAGVFIKLVKNNMLKMALTCEALCGTTSHSHISVPS